MKFIFSFIACAFYNGGWTDLFKINRGNFDQKNYNTLHFCSSEKPKTTIILLSF